MAKLKTELRVIEGEREAYVFQSQDLIRKQRREIEWMQKEKEELDRTLSVCECRANRQRDADITQDLLILLEHGDEMDKMLQSERQTKEQLDKEILSVERKLANQRRQGSTGGHSQRTQAPPTQKATHVLENDLNRALIRLSMHVSRNSQLREDLEVLCLKRREFQQRRQCLERELQEIHRDIKSVVDRSTAAHNTRVKVQMKIMKMKEMAVNELAQYHAEMKELEMVINQERHFQDFLTIKCHSRTGQEDHPHSPHEDEWEMREEMTDEMLAILDETFLKIHSFTGEENLDKLVRDFIEIEEQNSTLSDYVSKQNNEIKALKDQMNQIHHDIKHYHEDGQRRETEHQALMRDLQARRQAAEKKTQACNARAVVVNKIMDQVRAGFAAVVVYVCMHLCVFISGIVRVVRRLERMRSLMKDLPSSSAITNNNLLVILELIDQKVSGLLGIQAFLNSKDPDKAANDSKQNATKGPETGADDSEEGQSLTLKERRQQMIKEILQKEGIIGPNRGREANPSRLSIASSSQRRHPDA
ncbi:hypothetical protein AGOR_G00154290 [Albula goreensis]|uniref:ODAD1 central coiled coil region domain-containing protein n=1 Tax=Albula goreensis TaxID=1534307 RepID=A0A8T3D783_9TELE|nr:hypothetical protein AGOR_G00154290 [Albula goreensis]